MLDLEMNSTKLQNGEGGAQANHAEAILEPLGPNMLRRWPRVAPALQS